jgi:BirA family transcriptional regulator, biotin operon repressor / biotin---[acetyl-CoA-carboxylase] ligase
MNPREEWHLPTQLIGRRVLVFEQVDSTNTQAATLAHDPGNDGIVLLAEQQTAGRGQHGRTWTCGRGMGVLLSVLLFPPPALRRPVLLAAWAANSVCETIHRLTGLDATIKWPNDVLIQARKVCGILIESKTLLATSGDRAMAVMAGIGLNLHQTTDSFAEAGLLQAGSLCSLTGRNYDWSETAQILIEELDREYEQLCRGRGRALEMQWCQRIGLLGKPVVVEFADVSHIGRLQVLNWQHVEIRLDDGSALEFQPEMAKHIRGSAQGAIRPEPKMREQ